MISEIAQYTGAKTQILILNIQLPSGPNIVMYWHASIEKINANKLWKTFTNESDAYRQQRLKLLPNIHQGPWILQRAIGNAPVMLAQKVHVSYHKPLPHVFEIHANINSSLATKVHIPIMTLVFSLYSKYDRLFLYAKDTQRHLP